MQYENILDGFTVIACLVIAFFTILCGLYIRATRSDQFQSRKLWIEQLPTLISSLGVFGTFVGITKGLCNFDTSNLDVSIPLLLDGLKTAFFTSLFGMLGSAFLTKLVSSKFTKEEKLPDIEKAAKLIVDELSRNQNTLVSSMTNGFHDMNKSFSENQYLKEMNVALSEIKSDMAEMKKGLEDIKKSLEGICDNTEQAKDDIEEIKGLKQETKGTFSAIVGVLDEIKQIEAGCKTELPKLRAVLLTATTSISTIDNKLGEFIDKKEEEKL